MYFDFEDHRPDISPVGRAISWREGVLISIIIHMAMVIMLLTAPAWLVATAVRVPEEVVAANNDKDEPLRFVFVQPRVDTPAPKPPPRADLSDKDRIARSPERAEKPTNPLPLSRGNSPELVERVPEERARGRGAEPEPQAGPPSEPSPPQREPEQQSALALPGPPPPPPQASSGAGGRAPAPGGSLGDALKNLERYVQNEQLHNPRGRGDFGPAIQFDTMGVDFGRWILRFKAQVERNWFPLIPQAAMSMSGHAVLTFNVHKNGTITDLTIVKPSRIDGFNYAAYGAMVQSNPTIALPPEYPADKAFFTVTFFYNESPQ